MDLRAALDCVALPGWERTGSREQKYASARERRRRQLDVLSA